MVKEVHEDAELNSIRYWTGKHGLSSLKEYYPNLLEKNDQLRLAFANYETAKLVLATLVLLIEREAIDAEDEDE